MYALYKADCEERSIRKVSEILYRKFLNEKILVFMFLERTSVGAMEMHEEEKELHKEKYELHLKSKNAANVKKNGAELAKIDPYLEAILYCPFFHAKPIFYKRKWANFNFTVPEVASKQRYSVLSDQNMKKNEVQTK